MHAYNVLQAIRAEHRPESDAQTASKAIFMEQWHAKCDIVARIMHGCHVKQNRHRRQTM